MNEEKQKILNIFNPKVKLKDPANQKNQEIIKKLIIETANIEGKKKDHND